MRLSLVSVLAGVAAGAAATYAKTKAEQVLQPRAEKLLPPAPVEKRGLGADPAGHPENMPPSEVGDRVLHAVTGDELSDEQRVKISAPLHWGTGVGAGLVYGLLAPSYPVVTVGSGAAFGLAVFGATHASLLPAVGVQEPLSELPKAWWIWEGGSHVVYGLVVGTGYRLITGVLDRFA